MAFRIVDGSTTLFRVSHTRSGFVEDSLEDPFPPLVERPDGDPPQQAFRGHVMASGREPAGAFDVPLERERLDAGFLRPLEDGVRVTQGLCHARLPLRNFERMPRSAREVEGAAEVPGGLRLLRPVDEAPRERRVRGIPARCEEVFARRVNRPLHEVRSGSGGHRPIERLAARIAARPPVRHVRFAQRAAGHVAPTERMPSASGGNDRSNVGSAGINEASSISSMITVWLERGAGPSSKSFSSRPPFGRPVAVVPRDGPRRWLAWRRGGVGPSSG